jgi:hypothetical protein
MVQLAPAAGELEQVPCPAEEKSLVIDIVPKASVTAPVLVNATNCAELEFPTVWSPNVREVGEKLTVGTAALTVSVAVLLVTLPAELLTVTAKDEPLSDEVAAGVE